MSIIDRIKDLMSEMNPEEKAEFLEKMAPGQEAHEETFKEQVIPDTIECDADEASVILNARSSIISLKASYTDFCIQSKNKKREILENLTRGEDFLLSQVEAIKSSKIPNKELRDQYMVVVDADTKTVKLRKNKDFTDK